MIWNISKTISNNFQVDQAIRVICSAIANQVNWDEIKTLVSDAQAREDPVAMAIKSLKLETNTMVMSLRYFFLLLLLYPNSSSLFRFLLRQHVYCLW